MTGAVGDVWTWVAIDADAKFLPSWASLHQGERGASLHALQFHMHYNFGQIHKTFRVTPATEARKADHVRSLEEIAGLAQ